MIMMIMFEETIIIRDIFTITSWNNCNCSNFRSWTIVTRPNALTRDLKGNIILYYELALPNYNIKNTRIVRAEQYGVPVVVWNGGEGSGLE
jgi:hypothetical protein